MDVSFISATLVLAGGSAVRESGVRRIRVGGAGEAAVRGGTGERVGKGGIVRDPEAQQSAVQRVSATVAELGGVEVEVIESPILGTEGNREFLLHARFG